MIGKKMVTATGVVVTFVTAATLQNVKAQPLPSIDAVGTCPRMEDLQRLNPALDGGIRSLQERTGTPVRANVPLYRNSSLTGPSVEKRSSGYDDDVEVMVGARLQETGPALVRRMTDGVCGWMNVSDIEKSGSPLKLIQLPGFSNDRDRRQLPNQLDAHVVVKNRIDRQTGYGQRAPLFHAPFDGPEPPEAERRSNVGYFEVLSVYDVRRANGDPCQRLSEERCFLRVGTTTEPGRGAQSVTRTRGWMLGTDLEVWPSALAIYYGRDKQGLKIHANEPSARVGTRFADRGTEVKILALQPGGRYKGPKRILCVSQLFAALRWLIGRDCRSGPVRPWNRRPMSMR